MERREAPPPRTGDADPQSANVGRRAWLARVASVGACSSGSSSCSWSSSAGSRATPTTCCSRTAASSCSGNQVLVAGQPIGTVDEHQPHRRTPRPRSRSRSTSPLHEGTTAVIRATSLSGIANRYVSITPGPTTQPGSPRTPRPSPSTHTTSPVDLDQLFDTFPPEDAQGAQQLHPGPGRRLRPATRRPRTELQVLRARAAVDPAPVRRADPRPAGLPTFLVSGSQGARRDRRAPRRPRRPDHQREPGARARSRSKTTRSTARSSRCRRALRQANTTFVNLRAALDDLTRWSTPSKPATKDLAPFLRKLRPVAERSVPVFATCARRSTGPARTTTSPTRFASSRRSRARPPRRLPQAIAALDASQPTIEFTRPYAPRPARLPDQVRPGRPPTTTERPLREGLDRRRQLLPLLRTGRHELALRGARRALCDRRARADPAQPAVQRPPVRDLPSLSGRRDAGRSRARIRSLTMATCSPVASPNPKCDTSDVPPGP